jgi:hypothetical protein
MVAISNPYVLGLLGAAVIIAIIHLAEKYVIRQAFRRKRVMFPPDHAVASERVLKFVDVVAANHDVSDDQIVAALIQQDVPKLDSELLVRFVPMAFTWRVLREMGVTSFPSSFIVFDQRERPVEMPIAREHYFASALDIADGVVSRGFSDRITRQAFEAIITRSAEMDSANKVLAAGKGLAGSKIMPPALLGLSAEEITAARPGE